MDIFIVLSLALAVFAVGLVVVAGVVLGRQLQRLTAAVRRTSEQLTALASELNEETAVLNLEAEALQRRLAESRSRGTDRYTPQEDRRIPAGS